MDATQSNRPAQAGLPFRLGELRSHRSLTVVPLFSSGEPSLEYVGLGEAIAGGLRVTEVGSEGLVEWLAVESPLALPVLLYEGEELVGAKQNRVLRETILVGAGVSIKVPATCVERGRWSARSETFSAAPRAAYPALRRAQRHGQAQAWADIAAKHARLATASPTDAAEAMYASYGSSLDEFAQALPRLDGQSGVIVAVGGRLVCLDYVSRSDVFAGLYLKLLRGYALDALECPDARPLSRPSLGRFLGELELAERARRPAVGLGEAGELSGYVVGRELSADGEVVALSAFPAS